ncbi:hypothetical protein CPC08DRAFT_770249 [Agrocybe pediades]|nr:hypothetical protein CPC08DRAFT_770249 [Agrocybe pediades]
MKPTALSTYFGGHQSTQTNPILSVSDKEVPGQCPSFASAASVVYRVFNSYTTDSSSLPRSSPNFSPLFVTNLLWDVTDKDMDELSQAVFDRLGLNAAEITNSKTSSTSTTTTKTRSWFKAAQKPANENVHASEEGEGLHQI